MQEFEIIVLATGLIPTARQLIGWEAYEQSGGSVDSIAAAFVASTMFADKYNNGTAVDPNAPITSGIANGIISNALGTAPTANQVDAWVNTALPVVDVFKAFALGDQFSADPEPHSNIAGAGIDPFPEFFQIYGLATGNLSAAAQSFDGWWQYEIGTGSLASIEAAFVGSTMFANQYNSGTLVNPNATITSAIAEQIIADALGATPTPEQVSAWVETGLPVVDVFQAFALGDQYSAYVASHIFFP
jgi:hypothetical protein